MNSLTVRRLICWAIGMGTGFIISWLIITFALPALSPDPHAKPVSIAEYGRGYFLVTMIPIGLIFVTILDGILDARIWPD